MVPSNRRCEDAGLPPLQIAAKERNRGGRIDISVDYTESQKIGYTSCRDETNRCGSSGKGLKQSFRCLSIGGQNAASRSFTWSIHSTRSAVRASSTTMARSWLTSTRPVPDQYTAAMSVATATKRTTRCRRLHHRHCHSYCCCYSYSYCDCNCYDNT